jgi:hypothetical protein
VNINWITDLELMKKVDIKDNLIIKGNNLLVLHSLRKALHWKSKTDLH